ncbi:MAG: amidohydrolase family protein [Trueperaceae bacterium]|nr:MAG: amidohydrolase family protein [Trueperaceae bacterium]
MIDRRLLRAEIVYNGLGTPRTEGAVAVQQIGAEQTVIMVDKAQTVRESFPELSESDVFFAISPPPANAHTHLDLSHMPYLEVTYENFLRSVVAHTRAGHRGLEAAKSGVAELLESGIDVVGDIVTSEQVMEYLLQHPRLRGVAYWEVVSLDPVEADRVFDDTVKRLEAFRTLERPGGVKVGLSPHSPHTVSTVLMTRFAALSRRLNLPMQIHVAESPHEVALHRDGSGPLMEMLRTFYPAWQPSGRRPVDYLKHIGVLEARPTLVHMVHVTEEDVREVQRAGCVVVHCPRSNRALDCGRFPWELYGKHGVTVGFGSDSRGSSPSLSIEDEVAFARGLHAEKANVGSLVRAAVKGGHRALGLTPPRFVRGDAAEGLHLWRRRLPSGG